MIIEKRIKDFEKLGYGMFVHFGLYSCLGLGEWAKKNRDIPWHKYIEETKNFNPKEDWARELVSNAKKAGCRYITITTRHHDGFSLYDTKGLSDFDTFHLCGRDLISEFVEACNNEDIIPFFYHTMLDWHAESYTENFEEYLIYLRKSVELLCKNYGTIGGIWFDGMWDKPSSVWGEDEIYSLIRKYQPDAMIINNTGVNARGELGHIELDSVTFERGRPAPINTEGAPKYIASEMCEVFAEHWGYAKNDFNYKSVAELIESYAVCRRYNSNFIRTMDKGMLEIIGEWVELNKKALFETVATDIVINGKPKDFILKKENKYYLFIHDLSIFSDINVSINREMDLNENFVFDEKIESVHLLDTGEELEFSQEGNNTTIIAKPFRYGENYVVRVAEITIKYS